MKKSIGVLLLLLAFVSNNMGCFVPSKEVNPHKFAVVSDIHYYNPELGTEGSAFQEYLVNDRKLLAESDALINAFKDEMIASDVNFIIVPGDLTKDGEKVSHEKVASYLAEIEASGTEVYVICGNHDINNGISSSYNGDSTTRVENITAAEFKHIYNRFGYQQALYKDTHSLSYVVEPVKGIWLIAMDSCRYDENEENEHPITGGAFNSKTREWILQKIDEGVAAGKKVLGFMHHGVIEHFEGQADFFPEYLVDDFNTIAQQFSEHGMQVVFTGHYHAQDIVKKEYNEHSIYDIETGSLVTAPCPYRTVEWDADEGSLDITTEKIEEISYDLDGQDLQTYAESYLRTGLEQQLPVYLAGVMVQLDLAAGSYDHFLDTDNDGIPDTPDLDGYYVPVATIAVQQEVVSGITVANLLLDAFTAHYAGVDQLALVEEPEQSQLRALLGGLLESGDPLYITLGNFIYSLWSDPDPEDNNGRLFLK